MSDPEKCHRCLNPHAALRCDDGIHYRSALPYPQVSPKPSAPTNVRIKEREICPKCDKPAARMSSPYCAEHFDQPKDAGAREWWIRVGDRFVSGSTTEPDMVHVIEYAAYEKLERTLHDTDSHLSIQLEVVKSKSLDIEKLERELAEAKEGQKQLWGGWNKSMDQRQRELTQERAKSEGLLEDGARLDLLLTKEKRKSAALVEALKMIEDVCGMNTGSVNESNLITAREALGKWGKA